MSHAAPTAKPAAGPATRACGHAACRKTLMPPLLLCSKCKAEAYCCKECQVGHPYANLPVKEEEEEEEEEEEGLFKADAVWFIQS